MSITNAELTAETSGEVVYRALKPVTDPTTFYPGFESEAVTLPKGSTYGPTGSEGAYGSRWHGGTRTLPSDILLERDFPVEMRDGKKIYVDIFRPPAATNVPSIVAWSPYGKEGGFWSHARAHMFASPREEWISGLQKFEGPDPAEWVAQGYAVVNADARGSYMSEGDIQWFGDQEGRDGHDLIEWIAAQEWSNGRVGMQGNSWLAVAQWFIAAEQPPHLAAIAPWNGLFDIYLSLATMDGIPTPAFIGWLNGLMCGNGTRVEDLTAMIEKYPLKNEYWDKKVAPLEKISVPAYVASGPQPGFIHRWTPEAFRRLGSQEKWLRYFNTDEWYFQFNPEYVADLRRFFDRYLKGEDNGWEKTPQVRLTVLDPGLDRTKSANSQYADAPIHIPAVELDRPEDEWPLARTEYTKLYLDAQGRALQPASAQADASARYEAASGEAAFTYVFAEATELTGYALAKLWIELVDGEDADLFLRLEKLGSDGQLHGVINTAELRLSHREVDDRHSTEFMVYHTHRREQLLAPGEPVLVTIGFAPMSVRFAAGDQLRLRVAGNLGNDEGATTRMLAAAAMLTPPVLRNAGTHVVHGGGHFDSHLVLPVVPLRG